jgi:hypothetical protein
VGVTPATIQFTKAFKSLPFYLAIPPAVVAFLALLFGIDIYQPAGDLGMGLHEPGWFYGLFVPLMKVGLLVWIVRQLIRFAWFRLLNRSRALVSQWYEPMPNIGFSGTGTVNRPITQSLRRRPARTHRQTRQAPPN